MQSLVIISKEAAYDWGTIHYEYGPVKQAVHSLLEQAANRLAEATIDEVGPIMLQVYEEIKALCEKTIPPGDYEHTFGRFIRALVTLASQRIKELCPQ